MKFKKIYIEITNYCNKNCSFCLVNKREKKEISPTSFKYIIDEIKPFTDYVYLHVQGEPLLHSKFDEIIKICFENNIKVNITTNGSLIKKRKDTLLNRNIRQINISLQSYENNINIDEIKDILTTSDYLLSNNKELNIVYRFWALKNDNFSKINNVLLNIIIDHYQLSDIKVDEINNNKNIKIKDRLYINKEEEFEWPKLTNNFTSFDGKCLGTVSHIGILSDGTVVPCCLDANGIINLGNIFEKHLKIILNDKRFTEMNKKIHENKFNEELCQHCSFKNRFCIKKNK